MTSPVKSYLLDTQVALWVLTGSEAVNERAFRERFDSENSEFIFSQVSTWEIQIKFGLGKLPLPKPPQELLPNAIKQAGFRYERLEDPAIFFLDRLPPIHRDPFDRLLISQTIINGWTMISADQIMKRYSLPLESLDRT